MGSSKTGSDSGWVIELDAVRVLYAQSCALAVQRLRIAAAERVFVLGRSGSGKTTLARLLKGRMKPTSGRVAVLGADPASNHPSARRRIQRRIAMIDQEFFLVPRMTVVGNVLSGSLGRVSPWQSLLGWYPDHEWGKAEAILHEVELDGLGDRRVETLSGGQRQRAAIARALMQDADIILADEPVSSLDPELAADALRLLVDCAERRGVTLVVSLHQPALARQFASRFIGLAAGQVVYNGSSEDFTVDKLEFLYRRNEKKEGQAPSLPRSGCPETTK